ncbi:MAG TPA: hypothetical protein P5081_05895 [Phycisphaerae bacterium]|nr:hypothetical protein [Phycisphaerae bacterium]HRW52399.1 hypothetical protein [Phycisphaerae bacterium]
MAGPRITNPPSRRRIAGTLVLLFLALGAPGLAIASYVGFDLTSMLAAAACAFIVVLSVVCSKSVRRRLRDRALRATILAALRFRVLSLPITVVVDLLVGAVSLFLAGFNIERPVGAGEFLTGRLVVATLIHCALMIGTFAVLAWMRFPSEALRTGRQTLDGLCRSCGYDMRSTHQLCPECGAEAPYWHRPRQLECDVILRLASLAQRRRAKRHGEAGAN